MKVIRLKKVQEKEPCCNAINLAASDNNEAAVYFIDAANRIVNDRVKQGKTSAVIQNFGSVPPRCVIEAITQMGYDVVYSVRDRFMWRISVVWDDFATGSVMHDNEISSIDEMYSMEQFHDICKHRNTIR